MTYRQQELTRLKEHNCRCETCAFDECELGQCTTCENFRFENGKFADIGGCGCLQQAEETTCPYYLEVENNEI